MTTTETLTLEVNQQTREFSQGLTRLLADAKTALKSGNTLTEVLALTQAALTDLLPVLKDIPALPVEAAASPEAEVNTIFLFAKDLYAAIKS